MLSQLTAERYRAHDLVQSFATNVANELGDDYFEKLVFWIAKTLDVQYVLVGVLNKDDISATTTAFCDNGALRKNFTFELKHTPSGKVMDKSLVICSSDLLEEFPDDQIAVEMGLESYAGIPLRYHDKRLLGILAVLDSKPMENTALIRSVMAVTADRTSAELARLIAFQAFSISEQRYQAILDHSPSPIFAKDLEGRYVIVNRAFEMISNSTMKQVIGKTDHELFPKSIADMQRANDLATLRRNTPIETEARGLFEKEKHKTTSVSFPMFDGMGEIIGSGGIATDTSASEREFSILRESEELLRLVTNDLHALISYVDRDQCFRFVNREYEIQSCKKREALIGQHIRDVFGADTYQFTQPYIQKALNGESVRFEISDFRNSGRSVEASYVPHVECNDKVTGFLALIHDITYMKETEKALRESEHSLANAQRIGHFGNWDWNIVTNELSWSDEIYRIFGVEPQSFGATFDAFLATVHPDDRAFVEGAVDAALRENRPYNIHHRITLPDGTIREVHEKAEVLFDEHGSPISMSGTVQDVTELKRTQEQLAHVQKLKALGQLTGGVAHDFNNLLTVILGNLQLLESKIENSVLGSEFIDPAIRATRRGSELAHRLLAYARLQPLLPKLVNMADVLLNFGSLLERTLGEAFEFKFNISDRLYYCEVDPGQLENVLLNLAVNARDAMPNGGVLNIDAKNITVNETSIWSGQLTAEPLAKVLGAAGLCEDAAVMILAT